jgi:hypothetical protein
VRSLFKQHLLLKKVRSIYKMPRRTRSGPTALGKAEEDAYKAQMAAYLKEYHDAKVAAKAAAKAMRAAKKTLKKSRKGGKRGTRRR